MINLKEILVEGKNVDDRRGCLMAMLDERLCNVIVDFNKKIIKEGDLYHELNENGEDEYGREHECHITIRYGFTRDLNELEIRQLLKNQKSFMVELYGLDKFTNPPKFDVVMMRSRSPELIKLNELTGAYPNESDYPDYNPHLTLAYVHKGKFPHVKENVRLSVPVRKVCYSPIKGGKSYFDLEPND